MGIMDFLPGFNIGSLVPDVVNQATGLGGGVAQEQPYNQQLPSYRAQFIGKYQDLADLYGQLPESAMNALVTYDAGRVARGSPPLTREQTIGAIQTILNDSPATSAPAKNPTSVWENLTDDVTNVVKAIPRIPAALLHEVQDVGNFQSVMAKQAKDNPGQNGLAAFLRAPGVRMIPGAYTAGNVASGAAGVRESLSHPVMTALDLLPVANFAAKSTAVGAKAVEAAAAAGKSARPIKAVLTNSLDPATGELVRNPVGTAIDQVMSETKVGQGLSRFSEKQRAVFRSLGVASGRIRGLGNGSIVPANDLEAVYRATVETTQKYKFDEVADAEFKRRLELDDWSTASPEMLAARSDYVMLLKSPTDYQVTAGELGQIINPRNPNVVEVVRADQAGVVNRARRVADHYSRMVQRRADVFVPTGRSLQDALDDARAVVRTELPDTAKRVELRGIQHELDAMGYDVSMLRSGLNQWGKKGYDPIAGFLDTLDTMIVQGAVPSTRYTVGEIRTILKREAAKGNRMADRLEQRMGIVAQDMTKPRFMQYLKNLERSTRSHFPELNQDPAFAASIKSLNERHKWNNDMIQNEKVAKYTEKSATARQRVAQRTLEKAIPARFIPEVERRTLAEVTDWATPLGASPDEAARIATAVLSKNWKDVPGYIKGDTERLVADVARDIAKQWPVWQEAGFDPQFVHRITPQQTYQALRPTVMEVPNTITQLKERTLNTAPQAESAFIGLSHQAGEVLRRGASEEWIDNLVRAVGVSGTDLRSLYQERALAHHGANPSINLDAAFDAVMRKTHTPFNPTENGYGWSSERLKTLEADQMWVPNAYAKNLNSLHDPKTPLGGVFDPTTKLFRHSVIGASIRNLLYNITGGAVTTGAEIGPVELARNLSEGVRFAKDPTLLLNDPRFTDVVRSIIGGQREMFAELDNTRYTGKVANAIDFMKGRTVGRLIQQVGEAKAVGKVRDLAGKVIDTNYSINSFFDDAYKITAYMSGYDKAVAKGLSKDAAEQAGLELLRKVQPDWNGQIPLERALMKSIVPFYGFSSFALRYAFRYPMDHPLRAAILASFARAELEDLQTLPNSFLSSLILTGQSSTGQVTAANLAPLNPFSDVGNFMTIAGFLSATNPVIQTALESVGVQRGEAELYPTLRFDPETGRLAAAHPNPLMGLVANTVPQSQILTAMLGANEDFKQRFKNDPAAAYRTLISSAGLPLLWRGLNVPVEQAKAEVARQKSANAVLARAQKSGDWTEASSYPSLAAYRAQIEALDPAQAVPFQVRPDEQQRLIEEALAGRTQVPAGVGLPAPAGSLRGLVSQTGGI